jgi:hypothetical protein
MQIDNTVRGRERRAHAGTLWLVAVVALVLGALTPAGAVEMPALYTVEVPVDPDDPNAQRSAYEAALTEVLIRVTGSLDVAVSEQLGVMFPNPARLVRQYRPGPDNTLVVSLDGPEIERVLRQSGMTVWGSDRPLTIIWLAVDWGLGDREIVAADDPDRISSDGRSIDRNQLLREQVQEVAERRGLPIVFPLLDIEDLQRIGFIDVWGGFDEPLLEASARYEASSILVGRIRPDDLQPPRWTWYVGEQRFGWPGQPEEAINQLADALAARDAISGDREIETIELTISGISSINTYGKIQNYMENLRVVEKLSVIQALPDRIVYAVDVQGGAARLNNVLSLSNMLEPVGGGSFLDGDGFTMSRRVQSIEFRYRPAFVTPIEAEPRMFDDPGPES